MGTEYIIFRTKVSPHRSHDVEGTGQHFILPIMHFLVNASCPKLLDEATSAGV